MKLFYVILGLAFGGVVSHKAFAQQRLQIQPGQTITILPQVETTVTCRSIASTFCQCDYIATGATGHWRLNVYRRYDRVYLYDLATFLERTGEERCRLSMGQFTECQNSN